MTGLLLFLATPEMWILLLVIAGLLMIIGFRTTGLQLLGGVILLIIFTPFLESLIDILPLWLLIILTFFCLVSLLRLFLGARIADQLIADLLYDLIRFPFRFLGWLLRPVRRP
jgi:hypothetical protein